MNGPTEAAATAPTLISQELYDETLLENADAFDLSPEEAVAETTEQLVKQCSRTNLPSLDKQMINELAKRYLGHLFLSHPETTEGRRDRSRRDAFLKTLEYLDGRVDGDGCVCVESDEGDCDALCEAIDSVRFCISGRVDEVRWSRLKFFDFEIENLSEGGDPSVTERVEDEGIDVDENDEEVAEGEEGPARGDVAANASPAVGRLASTARAGLPYLTAFETQGAIFTLMSILGCTGQDARRLRVVRSSARCLTTALRLGGPGLRDSFCAFDLTRRLLRTMLIEYIQSTKVAHADADAEAEEGEEGAKLLMMDTWRDLLAMATSSCRRCEKNKVMFMKAGLGPKKPSGTSSSGENSCPNGGGTASGRGTTEADVESIGTSGVDILLSTLSTLSSDDTTTSESTSESTTAAAVMEFEEQKLRIQTEGCRLLAALCRYDDFRSESSSAVEHATSFHRAGAVPILMKILTSTLGSDDGESDGLRKCRYDLAYASMAAIRVLAVNDDIVQSLVAAGLLKLIPISLERCERGAPSSTPGDTPTAAGDGDGDDDDGGIRLLVPTLGTIRNLCGNDDIKSTLCNDGNTLQSIVNAMSSHPDVARIQEHGCATLAAMALRRPENALRILGEGGIDRVVVAMRRHPTDVPLQRQGCLAIRNVASRAGRVRTGRDGVAEGAEEGGEGAGSNAVREALLELGVENVLRDIAGRHRGSVDEAYAALRDLGCDATLVQMEVGPDGTPLGDVSKVGGGGVQMFGDVKPRFRHTFEESGGGGVGLMNERIAQHAAAAAATKGSSS